MLVGNHHCEHQRQRSSSLSEGSVPFATADYAVPMTRTRSSSFSRLAPHSTADCNPLAALQCACNNMKNATGPCQLWAVVHQDPEQAALQQELPLSLAFVSTSFNQWLNYAFRCEDKILFGILGCIAADGGIRLLKVTRFGANVKDDLKNQILRTGLLDKLITHHHGEIVMHPDDESHDIMIKIAQALNCDPCTIRL